MPVLVPCGDRLKLVWRILAVSLATVLLCARVTALDGTHQISQYSHTAWRMQDGVFTGSPHVITQTKDGYLWIGTESGLVRFDGVRFVSWSEPPGKRLRSSRVFSLLGGSDGSLWIGTGRGLTHWKNGQLTDYHEAPGFIESILSDPQDNIWMTRSQVGDQKGGLCEIAATGGVRCYGKNDGLPFHYAQPMIKDAQGDLWIGSSTGICRWDPRSAKADAYLPKELRDNDLQGVAALAEESDGSLWVGFARSGKGFGLQRFRNGTWTAFAVPGFDSSSLEVSALLMDRDGSLWIGTANQGIYRIHDRNVDHFGGADGLSSDAINGFYQDREGDLWVVTAKGIDRFHDIPVISFSIREGLTSEDAHSVLATHDGTVWIGNLRALDFWRDGELSAIREGMGLPGRMSTALFEDHAGNLWVGIDGGLTIYENGRFRPVNKPDGKPIGVVVTITEDVDHDIWAGIGSGGLFRIRDHSVVQELPVSVVPHALALAADPQGGIWLTLVHGQLARYRQGHLETFNVTKGEDPGSAGDLIVDATGFVWAATTRGLLAWKDGRFALLNSHNGLPCDNVDTLVEGDHGVLWLEAQCGFIAVLHSELEKWWQQPGYKVQVHTLDVFDGAQPALSYFRPKATKSADGKLWFATVSSVQSIDPAHLARNVLPPPVQLEQIIADRKSYSPDPGLPLPAHTHDIEIDYTALSFVVPQKVRFRYKLDGYDADWQDPQTRRQAFYSNLSPGDYRFHVIACNNDGVWNETGASLDFAVLPAFYQKSWFRVLGFALFAFFLWLLYRLRLWQVAARMQARLEERLEERERIARDLHDTLLQGFVSAYMQLDVANDRLPAESPAKPLVQRVLELMKQVSEEGRSAIRSLRSPASEGRNLEQVLSSVQEEFRSQEQVDFQIIVEGRPRVLHPVIRDEVCRVAREAVINAFRHSKATKIEVEIKYAARNLGIVVRDNGCGIDEDVLRSGREGHWGLSNMRERAEKLGVKFVVLSRAGAGTEVELTVPGKIAFETTSSESWWKRLIRRVPGKAEADVPPTRE